MPRFLIVDDDAHLVSALQALLEEDGHDVAAFTNPTKAAAALEGSAFDAIITDLEMPRMRGDELVRLARSHQPDACIFLVTARQPPPVDGACQVFEKPFAYDAITSTVARCRARNGGRCYFREGELSRTASGT